MNRRYYNYYDQEQKPLKYIMERFETFNSLQLYELLATHPRETVVLALREMAEISQKELQSNPGNSDANFYSYSLVWHYVCLRDAKSIDHHIEKIKSIFKTFEKSNASQISISSKINDIAEKIESLERFTKSPKFPYIGLTSQKREDNNLRRGNLTPKQLASLAKMERINILNWLEGAHAFLKNAPWSGHSLTWSFVADPSQRIEFEKACSDLIPEIQKLKILIKKFPHSPVINDKLQQSIDSFYKEWNDLRRNEYFPVDLWNDVFNFIEEKKTQKNEAS